MTDTSNTNPPAPSNQAALNAVQQAVEDAVNAVQQQIENQISNEQNGIKNAINQNSSSDTPAG